MGSGPQLVQVVLTAAVSGGSLLLKAMKNHGRIRNVADTPRSKIASAPQGFVELQGFAWPQGETAQTLDNEEAVYYVLELQREETSGSGKNRRTSWVTVFNHEHVVPFYLLDPTGVAVIIPHNSEVNFSSISKRKLSSLSSSARDRISELAGPSVSDFPPSTGFFCLRARNYRVIEKKLLLGSPTYATGDFKTHSFNHLTIDDALATFANKVIDFNSRNLKNVTRILDKDRDGMISAEEACTGYTAAASLSRRNPQTQTAPLEIFGTLDSSENHKLFIADAHEHHLLEQLGKWQTLKLAGGAALVTASICAGLLEFGLVPNPFEVAKAAQRVKLEQERSHLIESQKQINALHTACASGQGGFCRQLIERKDELQMSEHHLNYYYEIGCRSGEQALCRTPASK